MEKAVYPGSFDPITLGHLNIINRASRLVDDLIVAVGVNSEKEYLFSRQKRVEIIRKSLGKVRGIKVKSFSGLLVDFMAEESIDLIVRGLRATSDFEKEFKRDALNKKLDKELETIILMAEGKYNYLSSSAVKEVAQFDGCLEQLVPKPAADKLQQYFN